jgi:hypothetical protein
VFVEGVSQFGKNPVCGFVVLCGQDLSTEFADFIFSGHEVVGKKPHVSCPNVPVSAIQYILYEKDRHRTCDKEEDPHLRSRPEDAGRRGGGSRKHQRPALEMLHLRGRTHET